jgi:hypothetical protein
MLVPGALYAYWGSQAADLSVAMSEGRDWTYWAAIIASVIVTIWVIAYLRKLTLANIALEEAN